MIRTRRGDIIELAPAAQPVPKLYNAEVYQLPLLCWARAVTPAMPSIRSEATCGL